MSSLQRMFLRRVVVIPAIFAALVALANSTYAPPAEGAAPDPVAVVAQQTADLTEGMTCWEDPTGHTPDVAVVKDDGAVTVRLVTADEAWAASSAGLVWVEAWCQR